MRGIHLGWRDALWLAAFAALFVPAAVVAHAVDWAAAKVRR